MTNKNGRRNVALKLDDPVHAQLGVVAHLTGSTIPDVIRDAVNDHLDRKRSELADRASDVLADIEREAQERRATIEALLGPAQPPTGEPAKSRGRRSEQPTG